MMPSTSIASAFALALVAVLSACESSVSGSGGSTGTTSTTGDGGASSSCPATQPAQGAACSDPTLSCSYGACCPAQATCDGTTWSVSLPPCAPPLCPDTLPADGDACDPCFDLPSCDIACPDATSVGKAGCGADGKWKVTSTCPVPPPVLCGAAPCKSGEICLVKSGGAIMAPTCEANPCGSAALDCSCAQALCGGPPFQCSVSGQTLYCTCPNCP